MEYIMLIDTPWLILCPGFSYVIAFILFSPNPAPLFILSESSEISSSIVSFVFVGVQLSFSAINSFLNSFTD